MKKSNSFLIFKLIVLFVVIFSQKIFSQDNVGIGTNIPNPSAILELLSTNKGMLLPRMNTAAMLAITSPANSLIIYNTDTMCYFFYRQPTLQWINLCKVGTQVAVGVTGATGGNGIAGPTGATGASGTNGTNGVTGATGAAGTNGATGATGVAGTNGTNGPTGATGVTGIAGTNGINGTNGSNGATGPTGPAGTSISFPGGVGPVLVADYGTSAPGGGYTVTSGKTLYIINMPMSSSMYAYIGVSALPILEGAHMNTAGISSTEITNDHALTNPIIVGSGDKVTSNAATAYLWGFELNTSANITPITFDLKNTYTVPAGKTLYILNLYNMQAAGVDLLIDPTGSSSFYTYMTGPINTSSANGGPNKANLMFLPIIVGSGGKVTSNTSATGQYTMNGYLQ